MGRRSSLHLTNQHSVSEGWGLVVGGDPGLVLAFLFGDDFGSFAAFGGDAGAAVFFAGSTMPHPRQNFAGRDIAMRVVERARPRP